MSALWRRLHESNSTKRVDYLRDDSIGNNSGTPCPARSAIAVNMEGEAVPIHASRITFDHDASGVSTASAATPANNKPRTAIAGQSPQTFALCERFLVQGLDSGQGLFQFVSRKAHAVSSGCRGTSREVSIIDQLFAEMESCKKQNRPLQLGGRYEVVRLDPAAEGQDHHRAMLTVRDLKDHDKIITVPLTQAGLRFTDRVLGIEQIEQANALMNAHKTSLQPDECASSQPTGDPLIASFAGIGRNATLISYREVRARIDALPAGTLCDEQWLDNTLLDVINIGRRDRGNRFIHSDAQLQELRKALAKYGQEQNQNVSEAESSKRHAERKRQAEQQGERERHRCSSESARSMPTQNNVVHNNAESHENHSQKTLLLPAHGETMLVGPVQRSNLDLIPHTAQSRTPLANISNNTNNTRGLINAADQTPIPVTKTPAKIRFEDFQKLGLQPHPQGHLPDYGYPLNLNGQSGGIFFVPSPSTYTDSMKPFREKLKKSHRLQRISPDGLNCWMRASWLSILKSTTPSDLAKRLRDIARTPLSDTVKDEINYLAELSKEYMDANFVDSQVKSAETEKRLRALQLKIVGSYTHSDNCRDTTLIGELERLKAPDTTAITDLPMVLHRALGLPIMVVKIPPDKSWGQIRVAGPDNSALGREIAKWTAEPKGNEIATRTKFLLEQFRTTPVIWLQSGHYEVYMPL